MQSCRKRHENGEEAVYCAITVVVDKERRNM